MDILENFSNNLKILLKMGGVKKSDFANTIGIDRQTLFMYESGKMNPSVTTLVKIAKELNVGVDFMLKKNTMTEILAEKLVVKHVSV